MRSSGRQSDGIVATVFGDEVKTIDRRDATIVSPRIDNPVADGRRRSRPLAVIRASEPLGVHAVDEIRQR